MTRIRIVESKRARLKVLSVSASFFVQHLDEYCMSAVARPGDEQCKQLYIGNEDIQYLCTGVALSRGRAMLY